jgi:hypothetical protein
MLGNIIRAQRYDGGNIFLAASSISAGETLRT